VGDVQTDLVGFLSLENFENPFSLGFGWVSHGREFRECDDTKSAIMILDSLGVQV
jgi:hypothetical protein